MSWRKVSGVVCDRKLSAKVKGKMFVQECALWNGNSGSD